MITQLFNENKQVLRTKISGELNSMINTDFRAENEAMLGGRVGVEKLQKFLNIHRSASQQILTEGLFWPETFFALIEYQSKQEYPPTGVVSPFLKSTIDNTPQSIGTKEPTPLSAWLSGSLRIGLAVSGAQVDRDANAIHQLTPEEKQKQRLAAQLQKFQREIITLEWQATVIHAFLENEVGVVEKIGDTIAKISLPFTQKRLYTTGEETIQRQIAQIRKQADSIQRQMTSIFTKNDALSPNQQKILSDIEERVSNIQKYDGIKKTWSDLTLNSLGGKNLPEVVLLHRLFAGLFEGAYLWVEGIFKMLSAIVQIVIEPSYRTKVREDLTQFVNSLDADSAQKFFGMLPKLLDTFNALPWDRKVEGIAQLLGGILLPVGVGAKVFSKGEQLVQSGAGKVQAGLRKHATSESHPPTKPLDAVVGAGEILAGSALITTWVATRIAEWDIRGAKASKGVRSEEPPVSPPVQPLSQLPAKGVASPTEILLFSDQLLKDIRLIRSFFHRAGDIDQKNVGEVMAEITKLHKEYTKETQRLITLRTSPEIPLDSPKLREIHQKITKIRAHREELLAQPASLQNVLKIVSETDLKLKWEIIRQAYSPEYFPIGSTEYFRSTYIRKMTLTIEEQVRKGDLTSEDGIRHLHELNAAPAQYLQREYHISFDAEIQALRSAHVANRGNKETMREQSTEMLTLDVISTEFTGLRTLLDQNSTKVQKKGNTQMANLYSQLSHVLRVSQSNYQSSPWVYQDAVTSVLRELLYTARLHPEMAPEKHAIMRSVGKILAILEERTDLGIPKKIGATPIYDTPHPGSTRVGKKFISESSTAKFQGIQESDGMFTGVMQLSDGVVMTGKRGKGRFNAEGHFLEGELHLSSGEKLDYHALRDPAFRVITPSKAVSYPHADELFGDIVAFKDIYRLYGGKDMRTILQAYLYAPPLLKRKWLIPEDIIFLLGKMDTIEKEVLTQQYRGAPLQSVFDRIKKSAP
jgi:hypothetical protein